MRIGRKTGIILCGILSLAFILSGCGRTKVPENLLFPAISVTGDGEVTAYIVEDFDEEYYDLEELRQMVEKELAGFNEGHKGNKDEAAVSMISLKEYSSSEIAVIRGDGQLSRVEAPKAVLVLSFRDVACYRDYTGMDLFYGTVSQAQGAGYDLDVELVSVKDAVTIGTQNISELGNRKILIVQDRVRIYGPGKVQYITSGAAVNEDGSIEPSDTEDNTYIIMK